jgi:RES domain-containing protein
VAVTSWRIVAAARAAQAFDGEGARINGGRWNPPGAPVVYTAESAALAALEMLAHLRPLAAIPAYVLIPCEFDRRLVERLDRKRLPREWRTYPAPSALQLLGDQWIKKGVSAVLEVPSALVPTESNYLLNPRHRDFRTIRMGPPRPFELDRRLAG